MAAGQGRQDHSARHGYAAWSGIGIADTALVGMFYLQEPRDGARLCCITLIAAGVIGLKLFSAP